MEPYGIQNQNAFMYEKQSSIHQTLHYVRRPQDRKVPFFLTFTLFFGAILFAANG